MKTIDQNNLISTPGGNRILARTGLLAIGLGMLMASQALADDSLDVGEWALDSTSRALPKTLNTTVDIGIFQFSGGTGSLAISVNASASYWSVAKRYVIPMRYNSLSTATIDKWLKVLPAYDTGPTGVNNFDLEVKVNKAEMNLRLRVSGTDGVHAATANVVIESTGVASFSPSSITVAAVPTVAQFFSGSVLSQLNGRVGVNTVPSVDAALDINGGDTSGLRIRPRTTAGAPTTGTWNKGTLIVDATGVLFVCTANSPIGTPAGTWKKVGAP